MNRTWIASLSLSATALVGLALSEGYTDRAVQPLPGDKWTIGFGSTDGVKPGDHITPPQALAMAMRDVTKFEGAVKKCVSVPLYQYEYDAYVQFSYNVGPTNFCGSTLVKKLNAQDYAGACKELLRWNRFQGQPNKGLTDRREREYKLCISG